MMFYLFLWMCLGFLYYILNMNSEQNYKRLMKSQPIFFVEKQNQNFIKFIYTLTLFIGLIVWIKPFIIDTYEIWLKKDFYTGEKL